MPKFSANQLRNSFEPGNTSDWAVTFENAVSNKAPDASIFNFIKTPDINYSPVKDVEFDQIIIKTKEFSVGPGLDFKIPVFAQGGHEIKVVFYDNHFKDIRHALIDWAKEFLDLTKGRSPPLSILKDYCLLLDVLHFDRQSNDLGRDSSFYVVPDKSITFLGNQDFQADTIPVEFNIVGTRD